MPDGIVSENYKNLVVAIVDSKTGEITESQMEQIEQVDVPLEDKHNALAQVFKVFDVDVKEFDDQINKYQRMKADAIRKQDAVRKLLADSMTANGLNAAKTAYFEAKFRRNPPRVDIEPGTNLDAYTKTEIVEKVDKVAIKQDLMAGKQIPGCKMVQGERLEIK